MPTPRATVCGLVIHFSVVALGAVEAQQDLGHKLLGGVGIDAGVQSPPGLYIAARGVRFTATRLRNRDGDLVPLEGLDITAWGAALGLAFTTKPAKAPYLSFALGVPAANVSLSVDDPRVSIDRAGVGDMFIQPLKVGGRWHRFDAVSSYTLYIPTGRFEPRGGSGVGRGFWTQQISVGGAAFLSQDKQRRISALVSYDRNSRKRGIDITRGSTLQVQGGAGVGVAKVGTIGIAGYALTQVTNDAGADIPQPLRGLRERVFGLGPEVQFVLPKIGLRGELRLELEFGVRSRPQGEMAAGGLTYRAWSGGGGRSSTP